ncbi:DUF397 domain-containing protein [Glycomyces paridis]|uniref:DUF397 domain-containing protein n=1 Tax=Glycomyces paridis TaxID=2126555 RepID=A0A4S8PMB7_9ACTN|nr:DUF397 domain-containing protein [Glycomyces paridis]THV31917.1 DUF397 domain-containing protein [Glycomyces paridis]
MTVVGFEDQFTWRKAQRSANQGGNCVCVAADGDRAGIRDSKEGPTGPALWLTPTDWTALHSHLAR